MTVVPLAVVMAYADGFWMISLRGAVGAIERTGEPFASWLRESTLALPVFVLAVLGALTLAVRWFGPVLRRPRTVVATALLVVAAGTLVGIAALAASSAYDYHLQSDQLQLMGSMRHMPAGDGRRLAQQQQASLELQVRAVAMAARYSWSPTSCSSAGWWRFGAADWTSARPDSERLVHCPDPVPEDRDTMSQLSTRLGCESAPNNLFGAESSDLTIF